MVELEKYYNNSAAAAAQEMLKQLEWDLLTQIPIDLTMIAQQLGLTVYKADLKQEKVSAFAYEGELTVCESLTVEEKRWMLAYMIGMLTQKGKQSVVVETGQDKFNAYAFDFANHLLVDKTQAQALFSIGHRVEELAAFYLTNINTVTRVISESK